MNQVVSRKTVIQEYLDLCLHAYTSQGVSACVRELETQILSRKVKFPLLEYCAHTFHKVVAADDQISFCDEVEALKTEGGNVILGIILQDRLPDHFEESLSKATEYISKATVWYVCDIIGERVYGYSLLKQPQKTIPHIKSLSAHPANWVVRAMGAGVHYAVKKGLDKKYVETVFPILLSKGNVKDKEIRQGVGWAAKTIAKFHPDIIEQFKSHIYKREITASWFEKKVEIGLNRNKYARGNSR